MLESKDDFLDLKKVVAKVTLPVASEAYDGFLLALREHHLRLLEDYLTQEFHEAKIDIQTFLLMVDVARRLYPDKGDRELDQFIFNLRDEVRRRAGIPAVDGRFLTVDEYFTAGKV
jgi:hypothetical protein